MQIAAAAAKRNRRAELPAEASSGKAGRLTRPVCRGADGRFAKAEDGAANTAAVPDWSARRVLLQSAEGRVALAAELMKVRDKHGRVVPLLANRAQISFEHNHRRESVVLKARQMGLSTWIAGRFLLRTILVPGTVTVHVAHTREAATGLFRMVQRMWENLPDELREGEAKRGRSNAGEMSFPALDSEIRIASAAEPNAGRGLTMTNLHCSEVSRWQGDAAETLAGLRAALAPGGELVLESTPNGAYGCFYGEWQGAERRGAARHFFPWWWEPGYAAHAVPAAEWTEEEAALAARVALQEGQALLPGQIGFRRTLVEQFGAMRVQEFAEDAVSCFRESGACFFEVAVLAERLKVVPPPLEVRWGKSLRIFRPAVPGRGYVLAADPSGGGPEGDFAALQIVDVESGVQCAEMQARVRPGELARRIAELAAEYNGALAVVERNGIGAGVLAYLDQGNLAGQPAGAVRPPRLYRDGRDGGVGWLTDASSRERALARLGVLLSSQAELFHSAALLEECRSFVQKDGGRTEAAPGAHDDLVMAMAIAQLVRLSGGRLLRRSR